MVKSFDYSMIEIHLVDKYYNGSGLKVFHVEINKSEKKRISCWQPFFSLVLVSMGLFHF